MLLHNCIWMYKVEHDCTKLSKFVKDCTLLCTCEQVIYTIVYGCKRQRSFKLYFNKVEEKEVQVLYSHKSLEIFGRNMCCQAQPNPSLDGLS